MKSMKIRAAGEHAVHMEIEGLIATDDADKIKQLRIIAHQAIVASSPNGAQTNIHVSTRFTKQPDNTHNCTLTVTNRTKEDRVLYMPAMKQAVMKHVQATYGVAAVETDANATREPAINKWPAKGQRYSASALSAMASLQAKRAAAETAAGNLPPTGAAPVAGNLPPTGTAPKTGTQ